MSPNTAITDTKRPAIPPAVSRCLDALAESIEEQFTLWRFEDSWQPIQSDHNSGQLSRIDEVRKYLNETNQQDDPVVVNLSEGQSLLVLQLAKRRKVRWAAIACCSNQNMALQTSLAKTTLTKIRQEQELEKLGEQNESYAQQISLDFEELSWLREIVEHFEYCDVSHSFVEVAEEILTPLREVVKAESLLFLPAVGRQDISEERLPEVGLPEFRAGVDRVDDVSCQELVSCFLGDVQIEPVVNNQLAEHPEFKDVANLKTCLIVSVAKGQEVFGWLLAINRLSIDDKNVPDFLYHPNDISEKEFGTIEANLLGAAAVMLATHARNVNSFREKERLLVGVIRSMINALDAKDAYTRGHSDRVALMSQKIAEQIGLDAETCEQVYMTGLLHDIGKIGVPDAVLGKPGRLSDEEFDLIKQHPVIGYEILKHLEQLSYVLPGVLHHHEQYDGSGYPHGLAGEDIPLFGRILAVADAYDAMTSNRPYRNGMPFEKAENILIEGSDTQWDGKLVEAFFSVLNDIHDICEQTDTGTTSVLAVDNKTIELSNNIDSTLAEIETDQSTLSSSERDQK